MFAADNLAECLIEWAAQGGVVELHARPIAAFLTGVVDGDVDIEALHLAMRLAKEWEEIEGEWSRARGDRQEQAQLWRRVKSKRADLVRACEGVMG